MQSSAVGCGVLGFRLLPRLKNIGSIRLYRPDDTTGPAQLNPVLTRPIRWDLSAPPIRPDDQVRRTIGDMLAACGVRLSLGGQIYDPSDPMGKLFFNILATFAEFEVDLLRMRTREGIAIACAKSKLRGRQPKLSPNSKPAMSRTFSTSSGSLDSLTPSWRCG